MTATRWPVHPAPIPGEAASSWLSRLAAALHVDVDTLFADVGYHLEGPDDLDGLDVALPARFARRLATRTGVPTRLIRQTALAGYQPGILGTAGARDQFAAYTREFSILLPPGRRRDRYLPGWLVWIPADGLLMWRACPQCLLAATPPPYPYLLAWAIPVMLTCPIHDRWLEFYADPPGDYIRIPYREPPPPSPAVTAMDIITWQAITTGHTTLPGDNVPATTWFRLLRTLIDEISAVPPEYGNAPTVTQHAPGSGRPAATEQHDWRPYEDQPPDAQDQILEAAATAIAALHAGTTTGRGDAARLFQPRPTSGQHRRAQTTSDTFAAHS